MRVTLYQPQKGKQQKITFVDTGISAGFPSPAEDFTQKKLSLDDKLIQNKEATFYARVQGVSMINAGLDDGDLLVIDRSIPPKNNHIAVCYLNNEFTVKRLAIENKKVTLIPENEDYEKIEISEGSELIIWGIVTYVIKKV
ncbi:LexA family protein [Aquimarina agarilytica]|uniref:LexA family protein n=1 Tax=Aquimarina agarilytica TaxID=1087449 RepID=UPI00028926AA|nr:translesion error-prone DNA polymerase V autoproteolytic subunit [Aquimarina agarilytica]